MKLKNILVLENVENLPVGELGGLLYLKNNDKNELKYHNGLSWINVNSTELTDIEFDNINLNNLAQKGVIYYKTTDNNFYKSNDLNILELLNSDNSNVNDDFNPYLNSVDNLLYLKTSGNSFINNSTNSKDSNTTFTFNDVTLGNAIYFGCNKLNEIDQITPETFFNLKVYLSSFGDLGTGSMEWQYYTGSTWKKVNCMMIDNSKDYLLTKQNDFTDSNLDKVINCYFNKDIIADWSDNSESNSIPERKWLRLIITGNITTAPIFKWFEIGYTRVERNNNGLNQYFGDARGIDLLPINWSTVEDITGMGAMDTIDNYVTNKVAFGGNNNRFRKSTNCVASIMCKIPDNMDHSCPLILNISWYGTHSDTSGKTISLDISTVSRSKLDNHYDTFAAAPTTFTTGDLRTITVELPAEIDSQVLYESNIKLDVSNYIARGFDKNKPELLINIERITDTYRGSVIFINATGYYTKWGDNLPFLMNDSIN